jgi:hypothetical protein
MAIAGGADPVRHGGLMFVHQLKQKHGYYGSSEVSGRGLKFNINSDTLHRSDASVFPTILSCARAMQAAGYDVWGKTR